MFATVIEYIALAIIFGLALFAVIFGFCRAIDCFTNAEDPWK